MLDGIALHNKYQALLQEYDLVSAQARQMQEEIEDLRNRSVMSSNRSVILKQQEEETAALKQGLENARKEAAERALQVESLL